MNLKNRIIIATPLICLFLFLLIGFVWDLWHPGWLVFLLSPIMPYLLGKKKIKFSIPLIIVIIYILIGAIWNLWHPGWIILILIPIFMILFPYNIKVTRYKNENKTIYVDVEE